MVILPVFLTGVLLPLLLLPMAELVFFFGGQLCHRLGCAAS
jgi:hypothetical protein